MTQARQTPDETIMLADLAAIAEGPTTLQAFRVSTEHYQWLALQMRKMRETLQHIDEYATSQCAAETDEGALWAQCASFARAAIDRARGE